MKGSTRTSFWSLCGVNVSRKGGGVDDLSKVRPQGAEKLSFRCKKSGSVCEAYVSVAVMEVESGVVDRAGCGQMRSWKRR